MRYLIIFLLLLFSSCNKDIENITFEGKVMTHQKSEGIANVKITFICWKYGNSPDASYSENETIIVRTDNNGNFKVNFNKGAFIEIKVSLNGYYEYHYSKEIFNKNNKLNISLKNK